MLKLILNSNWMCTHHYDVKKGTLIHLINEIVVPGVEINRRIGRGMFGAVVDDLGEDVAVDTF